MIEFLKDISVSFLLASPLFILFLRVRNLKEFAQKDSLSSFCFILGFLNFFIVKTTIQMGDVFEFILYIQLLLILPMGLGANYYISRLVKGERLKYGMKKSQMLIISCLLLPSIIISIVGVSYTNQQVLLRHEEFVDSFIESVDPLKFIIENTDNPSTMLDVLDKIDNIKVAETKVSMTLGGKRKVLVKQEDMEIEFTYFRQQELWKLDGVYRISYQNVR
ncbi:hypothetical protein HYG86_05070 [Alkalicella caledoniensis]|uniref:Uncharacterized protein n=1 Tax=Alkalicella caledoniensis TaxID=2731377 RepID=A0A7G9W674_ALKCA|nr:hypothetical protein [Alkalicella caledoniensis]QNO14186.1 hypothetical protein HYG86_05070 [Alkalicella caledoniensis]